MNITLSGRIDSHNAAAEEARIFAQLKDGEAVVVDAQDLTYISSAGLRVLLRVRKSHPDLQIINDNTGAVVYQMKNARAAASQPSGRKAESVKKAEPASVEQVQPKAKKGNLTLDRALDHKLPNKTGDMLSLKEYISVCKTTEQRDRMMKFLAEKVKERSEHSEACLIVHRALQSHEISFS